MLSARQNYKRINNPQNVCDNRSNNDIYSTGTLSFQALQQIKYDHGISVSINIIKHFHGKISEKYNLKKETDNPPKDSKSGDVTINEIMETITSNENDANGKESAQESTNEEDLLNLFKQYSDFTQPTSD